MAVFERILSGEDHLMAEQIHKEVTKKNPFMNLVTFFQALHPLTDMRMLQELGFSDGSPRYDPNIVPHINIICLKCGKIYDYEAESVKKCGLK